MRRRSAGAALAVALALAGCSSGDVDRLATDTCDVLVAHQAGEIGVAEVDVEFASIVRRAEDLGASIDLIEAQVQVQCFDALQSYLEAAAGEG